MNIVHLTQVYHPVINGVVRHISLMTKEQKKLGHEVAIIAPHQPRYFDKEFYVFLLPSTGIGMQGYQLQVPVSAFAWNMLRKADIIHVHTPFLIAKMALQAKRKLKKPIIFTHHSSYTELTHNIPGNFSFFDKTFVKPSVTKMVIGFANKTDAIIAPNETIRQYLQEGITYRYLNKKKNLNVTKPIHLIYTGCDALEAKKADGKKRRHDLGLNDVIVYLYIGRVSKEKNIPELISAFSEAKIPGSVLLIIGDGPMKRMLQKSAPKNVLFIGSVPMETIFEYYKAGDIFVSASTVEVQPLTFAEACVAGLPIVCYDSPGSRAAVEDNGIRAGSHEEFVYGLQLLGKDPSIRSRYAKRSLVIAEKFSSINIASQLISTYQEVIDGQ